MKSPSYSEISLPNSKASLATSDASLLGSKASLSSSESSLPYSAANGCAALGFLYNGTVLHGSPYITLLVTGSSFCMMAT